MQARFVEDLEGLAIALEGSSTGADLLGLPIDRLRETLDGLINDEENLAVLPLPALLLLAGIRTARGRRLAAWWAAATAAGCCAISCWPLAPAWEWRC